MKVSIITPLYNCSDFLEQTIKSVLAQTYENWEMIMVDDCSTDNSLEIAKEYASKDRRIKIIELTENSGAAVARNTAIEAATGRFIAFLDSDDIWLPEKLEKQVMFMQNNNIAFSYTAYEKMTEDGIVFGKNYIPKKVNYKTLLKTNIIGCLTAMYDTHKLGKVYMPLIRKRQDFGLWLRILKKEPYAFGIQEILGQYRLRSGSISSNKRSAAKFTWRLYRVVEKLNLLQASYYFVHYAINGVLRTKLPHLNKRIRRKNGTEKTI